MSPTRDKQSWRLQPNESSRVNYCGCSIWPIQSSGFAASQPSVIHTRHLRQVSAAATGTIEPFQSIVHQSALPLPATTSSELFSISMSWKRPSSLRIPQHRHDQLWVTKSCSLLFPFSRNKSAATRCTCPRWPLRDHENLHSPASDSDRIISLAAAAAAAKQCSIHILK